MKRKYNLQWILSLLSSKCILQNFSILIVFYLAVSSIFPIIRVFPWYNLSTVIATLLWVALAALSHPNFFISSSIYRFLLIFFVIYTATMPYFFNQNEIGNRYLILSQIFIFYLFYEYNKKYSHKKSNIRIVIYTLPFIIFTSLRTLYGLISNPYLVRSIKSEGEHSEFLHKQGIGGYEFIYFLVIVISILFFAILMRKALSFRFKHVGSVVVIMLLFGFTIIFSNYFTGLLVMVFSLLMLILLKERSLLNSLIVYLLAFLGLIFSKSIILFSSDILIKLLANGKTVNRIMSLQSSILNQGGVFFLLKVRLETLEVSWDALLSNPLFGSIVKPSVVMGNHSFLMDTFALYGVFLGIISLCVILIPFIGRFNKNGRLNGLNLTMMICVFLLFFLNNATPSMGFAVFFIYPVMYDWLAVKLSKSEKIEILQ